MTIHAPSDRVPQHRIRWGVAGVALVLLLAGCGSSSNGTPRAQSTTSTSDATTSSATGPGIRPPFPTLTAPDLQPPKQQNENRPDVAFDPCTWIDDETIKRIGYDPESRKRATDIHAEYTFLGCEFKTPNKAYVLSILSGNRTMDEGRAKAGLDGDQVEDVTIDGHAAMIVRQKRRAFCNVLLQTKVGYVDFGRIMFGDKIEGPIPEQCAGMVDLVRAVIPRIGDN
ncbi:DUF3558 domain-containing protein [Nocardia transvalensis]|uniref:DUF3558 domain-containing protein n=1 Tax=Nocardia transvalensis TaxID=37333 RepID=UPI001892DE23|nr:DUF3558 domain-containing protein [Nocardia transvalensis]MBF6331854.1 DUF3558 domain-containing protein [Nocardia transvalensis]